MTTASTPASVADRVDAGWDVMERAEPGWWRSDAPDPVDLDSLDLAHPSRCVLGQKCPLEVLAAFAGPENRGRDDPDLFAAYVRELSGASRDEFIAAGEWAHDRGFTLLSGHGGWHDLTDEWKRRIAGARAQAEAVIS